MKNSSIIRTHIYDVIKACIIAIIISLVGVLALTLLVKIFTLNENVIMPINQAIKIISIVGGCVFGFGCRQQGALKGVVTGVLYVLLSVLIFGIVEKHVSFKNFNWLDLLMGAAAGVLSGILSVNIKKQK